MDELIFPLNHLVNPSFYKFPVKLYISKVVPLHKKGKKEDIENYRTISMVLEAH